MFFLRRNDSCLSLLSLCLVGGLLLSQRVLANWTENLQSQETQDEQDIVSFITRLADLYLKLDADSKTKIDHSDRFKALEARLDEFLKIEGNRDALLSQINALADNLPTNEKNIALNSVRTMPLRHILVGQPPTVLDPIRNLPFLRRLKYSIQHKRQWESEVTNDDFVETANIACKYYHFNPSGVQLDPDTTPNIQLSKLLYANKVLFDRSPTMMTKAFGPLVQHYYLALVCDNVAKYPNYAQLLDRAEKEGEFATAMASESEAARLKANDQLKIEGITQDSIRKFNEDGEYMVRELVKTRFDKLKLKSFRWSLNDWAKAIKRHVLRNMEDDNFEVQCYNLMRGNLILTEAYKTEAHLSHQPSVADHANHQSGEGEQGNNEKADSEIIYAGLQNPWLFEWKAVDFGKILNPRTDSKLNEALLKTMEDQAEKKEAYLSGGGLCTRIISDRAVGMLIDRARKLVRDSGYVPQVKKSMIQYRDGLSVLDVLYLQLVCLQLSHQPLQESDLVSRRQGIRSKP